LIIKNSDAFEIKKIENKNSSIALNSSYPKNKLYISDTRITTFCKNCEKERWEEKDFFYIIGCVKNKVIKNIFIIQGECYCADPEIYKRLYEPLKDEIELILTTGGFEKGETNELGKVRRVDPLGITDLRIRGMWHIQNPFKVFESIIKYDLKKEFSLYTIMTEDKYNLISKDERIVLEKNKEIIIIDSKIKNPNNPAKLMDIKLISFSF
ncbi:MAG: NgoPII family restriction endonuclease, partial [Nanoarchaeota archaeon]